MSAAEVSRTRDNAWERGACVQWACARWLPDVLVVSMLGCDDWCDEFFLCALATSDLMIHTPQSTTLLPVLGGSTGAHAQNQGLRRRCW